MAKKAKEESLDLLYSSQNLNKKQTNKSKKKSTKSTTKKQTKNVNKNYKAKEENTKDEKFNFDNEIIIGLKRIDEPVDKTKKSSKVKKEVRKNKKKKSNKRKSKEKQQNTASKPKQNKDKIKEEKMVPDKEIPKKKRGIYRVIKWTTLLIIIFGGIIYTLLSPIFNINTISVVGNSKISSDEIISLSKIELETNMFKCRKDEIISNIKENAYIDTVKIKRIVPDQIEITVSERKASFIIPFANAYAFINNQGYILEISDKKANLPMINGIQTVQEDIQTGNRLCTNDLKKLGDVLKIMESATSNGLSSLITQIDITDSDDYILKLPKKKKTVHLGDISNLGTKMLWILKFNELEGNAQGEIILNMNLNDENSQPYFRRKV